MKNWKFGLINNGIIKHEADGGSNGGTGGQGDSGSGSDGIGGQGDSGSGQSGTTPNVEPKLYDPTELENVMGGIMNIEDRGELALTLNNVRNTARDLTLQRDNLTKENETLKVENDKHLKRIGELYAQLGKEGTIGDEAGETGGATTKTLMDIQREVLG